jgi:hypothetical protein
MLINTQNYILTGKTLVNPCGKTLVNPCGKTLVNPYFVINSNFLRNSALTISAVFGST